MMPTAFMCYWWNKTATRNIQSIIMWNSTSEQLNKVVYHQRCSVWSTIKCFTLKYGSNLGFMNTCHQLNDGLFVPGCCCWFLAQLHPDFSQLLCFRQGKMWQWSDSMTNNLRKTIVNYRFGEIVYGIRDIRSQRNYTMSDSFHQLG